ncbi:MAG: hypothetical protein IPM40_06755 [Gammaproteobacteria bacterium]|nr:hypothetical protein [Gammaproteobacteria bacterium]
MQTLRQLTPQDVLFVGGETSRIYQHTVGLMLIDGRDRATPVISTATRPLWEAWFIEGLPDGQFAVVHKMHHCMMDGEGASKLLEILCDFTRDATPAELDRAIAKAQAGEVPQLWRQGRDGNPADAAAPARERRGPYRTGGPGGQAHGRRVSDVDPWLLVAGLDRALGEYLALTGKSATRSKARGAGSRAGRTATSGARKPAGAPKRSTGGKRAS